MRFYFSGTLSVFFLFIFPAAYSQTQNATTGAPGNPSVIHLKIKTTEEDEKPMYGVTLKLFQDTLAPAESQTSAPDDWTKTDGAAELTLPVNKRCTISFSKAEYISYLIIVDTRMTPDDIASAKPFYELEVKMFKEETHPKLKNISYPIALIQYNPQAGKYISNKKYAAGILAAIKAN